jgi:hypothetical protein
MGGGLVLELMRLCFLMERQYAPYSKWFGTAFSGLACASTLSPILSTAVRADTWRERENALIAAYREVASMHNALRIYRARTKRAAGRGTWRRELTRGGVSAAERVV